MRSFSKNKFLLCFRPVVDIDCMLESQVAPHRSSTCRFPRLPSSSDKHDVVKNSEAKSVYFHQFSPKRRISRVIKAVFYETILNKRDHHKNRYIHDAFGYKAKYLSYGETKTLQSPLSTLSSPGSASTSSSSHASPLQAKNVSNYYSTMEKRKEGSNGGPQEKQKKFECFGIYLVLISLVFTVFWGKLFGIILTSTWLYFFAVWDSSSRCQKRLHGSPRLRQSLQSKDIRNYSMVGDYHMAMVPVNFHITHNRDLQYKKKIIKLDYHTPREPLAASNYHNVALNFYVRIIFFVLGASPFSVALSVLPETKLCWVQWTVIGASCSSFACEHLGKDCRAGQTEETVLHLFCFAFVSLSDMTLHYLSNKWKVGSS
ncbi:hypothetical protein VNO78_06017 [Psophocarpus tetragonolobus]|uniref:Uncharacterized protein n=1 Tax=Psophocarpus tetragonolobus TaxID=3891 RepID=A0AAN9XQU7_PSOTE